jgi:hypothetical protein
MENAVNKFGQLKGYIIDSITRSFEDEDDFDLVMLIGKTIDDIESDYLSIQKSRDLYKQLWYGDLEKQKELQTKPEKLQETIDELKES